MARSEVLPPRGTLGAVRRLAGPEAVIVGVVRLEGGQHAQTWRVDLEHPGLSVVVRQFPVGDCAGAREQVVLRTLDGLGGLAPVLLDVDLDGRWSQHPTLVISALAGTADITPADPGGWAAQLGRALATVHAVRHERLTSLPSIFAGHGGSRERLGGPLASQVRSRWAEIVAAPEVLTHSDFWSGNVVWRDGRLSGVVDWAGAARGPCGFDLGWCRLDLALLFDESVADVFLRAYEAGTARAVDDVRLWDSWATARSHDAVESWVANYVPLGRVDLDETELRRRHALWTRSLRWAP